MQDPLTSPYSARFRVCDLSQLQPGQLVSGESIQECEGLLSPAQAKRSDEMDICIRPDAVRSSVRGSMDNVFLPVEETAVSRLLSTWYRGGVTSVLDEVASGSLTSDLPGWVRRLAALLSKLIHLPYSNTMSSSAVTCGHQRPSLVQCLTWHPHTSRLAVSLRDDSIRVYQRDRVTVPIIKHRLQRQVADLDWKPHSASLLAVACGSCILVWTVEPGSVITRLSGSCAQPLSAPGHAPVTSVRWRPTGDLLLSASRQDSALLLWNVAAEQRAPLARISRAGNTLVRWNPDGTRVLNATTSACFRVWETGRWTERSFGVTSGQVTAACWSPDGRTMLFSIANQPAVFALSFTPVLLVDSPPKPSVVIDLTAQILETTDHQSVRVGGLVRSLTWDRSGRRLAAAFTDSDVVAVFATELQPHLRISPCGVIAGLKDEFPAAIEFQKNVEDAASLCVAWSSGRVQQIPMLQPRPATVLSSSLISSTGVQLFSVPTP